MSDIGIGISVVISLPNLEDYTADRERKIVI